MAMTLLAALAGGTLVIGLLLLVIGLRGRVLDPGSPPPRLAAATVLAAGTRRRAVLAILAGLAVFALTRWPVGAVIAAAAVLYLPRLTSTSGQRQRTAMLEGLEQWIRRLADMVTASRGLEDALEASARSAPAAIAGPVNALAARISARTGIEAALRAFAADIDDPAGDRIAAALIIATGRRGGGSKDVLTALAALLARDVAARREIDAERAQHRTTVKWIALFVAGFTVFAVLNRSYSAPFGTAAGQVVLGAVACLYAAGLAWLHRLGSIAAPGRFLTDATASRPAAGQAGGPRARRVPAGPAGRP
jgi:Flp pilus assembly protein TadB